MKINLNLIIALLATLLLILVALLSNNENERKMWFEILSVLSSVFTIVIAVMLYDKLDARKLAFSKQAQAVDDLVSELVFKKLTFVQANLNNLDAYKANVLTPLILADFYLNWSHLNNNVFRNSQLPIYFSQTYVDLMKGISTKSLNPWLPEDIRSALKGLVIYNGTIQLMIDDRNRQFVVLSEYNSIPDSNDSFYMLGYDQKYFATTKEVFNSFNNLLWNVEKWYKKNLGTSPDFKGH